MPITVAPARPRALGKYACSIGRPGEIMTMFTGRSSVAGARYPARRSGSVRLDQFDPQAGDDPVEGGAHAVGVAVPHRDEPLALVGRRGRLPPPRQLGGDDQVPE